MRNSEPLREFLFRFRCTIILYIFEYAGQNCNAGKRIIVREELFDKFIKAFYEKAKSLRVRDPLDESADVGPVINKESIKKLNSVIEDAKVKGGKVDVVNKGPETGYFFPLTLITNADLDMLALKTEVFGPIAPHNFWEKR
jgi:succinyl-CoA reductase